MIFDRFPFPYKLLEPAAVLLARTAPFELCFNPKNLFITTVIMGHTMSLRN
jgi:hypothetical protein